jgi:hypothetical protein
MKQTVGYMPSNTDMSRQQFAKGLQHQIHCTTLLLGAILVMVYATMMIGVTTSNSVVAWIMVGFNVCMIPVLWGLNAHNNKLERIAKEYVKKTQLLD